MPSLRSTESISSMISKTTRIWLASRRMLLVRIMKQSSCWILPQIGATSALMALQIAYSYTFKQVEGNKLYSIHARKGNKEINTKITFTFLPLLVLQGSFGYDYAQGSMSLYSPDATEPTIS